MLLAFQVEKNTRGCCKSKSKVWKCVFMTFNKNDNYLSGLLGTDRFGNAQSVTTGKY